MDEVLQNMGNIIREMQIKTTMKATASPIPGWLKAKTDNNKHWLHCGEIETVIQC